MTDIVERLRLSVTKGHEPTDEDAIEAANEIERLLAYVEEWKRRYETARQAHEEGRDEIERLRAVLANISGAYAHDPACTPEALAHIAQQGLEKSPPT